MRRTATYECPSCGTSKELVRSDWGAFPDDIPCRRSGCPDSAVWRGVVARADPTKQPTTQAEVKEAAFRVAEGPKRRRKVKRSPIVDPKTARKSQKIARRTNR